MPLPLTANEGNGDIPIWDDLRAAVGGTTGIAPNKVQDSSRFLLQVGRKLVKWQPGEYIQAIVDNTQVGFKILQNLVLLYLLKKTVVIPTMAHIIKPAVATLKEHVLAYNTAGWSCYFRNLPRKKS